METLEESQVKMIAVIMKKKMESGVCTLDLVRSERNGESSLYMAQKNQLACAM